MLGCNNVPYTIGFFTTVTNLEYSTLLAGTVTKIAQEENINLINFLGGSLNPNFTFSQYKYQYQCNVVFNFAHSEHLDGIILASGTLASFLNSTDYSNFYSKFKPIPMVSLGVQIPDLPSVYTNNTAIFKELVNHLIHVHNRKNIAFVSGPSSNRDAFDRYLGYTSALDENKMAYRSDYVYTGDFTPVSVKDAVHTFLDEKKLDIDAIVCANDSMALTIMSELKKRGILIPEQIIVTGCDDIPSSAYSVPSLTSIEQSLEQMARSAVLLLLDMIKGNSPTDILLPSRITYRESCGCHIMPYSSLLSTLTMPKGKSVQLADTFLQKCLPTLNSDITSSIRNFVIECYELILQAPNEFKPVQTCVESFFVSVKDKLNTIHLALNLKNCMTSLKDDLFHLSQNPVVLRYIDKLFSKISHSLFNYLLDYYSLQSEKLNNHFNFTRQFLTTITNNISNKEQQLLSIIPSLIEAGITSCLIYLYPKGITHNLSDEWEMPDDIDLYMGYIKGQIINPDLLPCKVNANEIAFYGFEKHTENYTSCIHPIFFGNEQLGVVVFEMDCDNYTLIDNLTVELGCALKLTSSFTAQKQVESKLETLSQTDEMTNLLNRRGFFNFAEDRYAFSLTEHQGGILFYADMDGLKTINDTFGHHEGDFAIIQMSRILKKAFCHHEIIGRIGGDEFVILSTGQSIDYLEEVTHTVDRLCTEFNTIHQKPYKLSISIGGIYYSKDDIDSLEYLLSRADKILYDTKRAKKERLKLLEQEKDRCDLI